MKDFKNRADWVQIIQPLIEVENDADLAGEDEDSIGKDRDWTGEDAQSSEQGLKRPPDSDSSADTEPSGSINEKERVIYHPIISGKRCYILESV